MFVTLYAKDPIFKNKVILMFEEEKRIRQTYGDLIAKEKKKVKVDGPDNH